MRIAFFIAAVLGLTSSVQADFVHVSKAGISPVPFVLFPDAPPLTRAAAVELADCIEKTCGERPELIKGVQCDSGISRCSRQSFCRKEEGVAAYDVVTSIASW
jgi:hypothetical protein